MQPLADMVANGVCGTLVTLFYERNMQRRIISLVPSLTQTIAHMGLAEEIVGCTHFCVDPPGLHRHTIMIGGTKDPSIEIVKSLKPTHILVNTEENTPQHIAACRTFAPALETFPKTLSDVPSMFCELGDFLECPSITSTYSKQLTCDLDELAEICSHSNHFRRKFLYFVWRHPYMVAGHDTYISNALKLIGWTNMAPPHTPNESRYPTLGIDSLQTSSSDLLLFASEPYPFRKRDAHRMRQEWPLTPEILKIDGKIMSWYGALSLNLVSHLKDLVLGKQGPLIAF